MARTRVDKNIAYDDVKKLYYVTMDYGKDANGTRVKKTKTAKTKQEARKLLKEFEADKTKGLLVIPSTQTIESWLDYWLNTIKARKCEETTLYGYRNIINRHILPALGKVELQKLTPHILNTYFIEKANSRLSTTTLRKHYDLLKDAMERAVDEEVLLKNPLNKIDAPRVTPPEIQCYNGKQLNKLLELSKDNRLEIVIYLGGFLGLRREEIAGLKWKNVHFDKKIIFIKEALTQAGSKMISKGTKSEASKRELFISDEILQLFKQIKAEQEQAKEFYKSEYDDTGYVFARDDGSPYRPNYISKLFRDFLIENNLPVIRLHDLRHSFASIANDADVPITTISNMLGHSNIGTTYSIYTHSFDKANEKAIMRVQKEIKSD